MTRCWPIFALACILALGLGDAHAVEAVNKPSSCAEYVGLSNRIVMCVRDTIGAMAYEYFEGFYQLVRKIIGGFLTLTIIIYGILAAYGMLEKISRDTFMLIIKFSAVSFFVVNGGMMYDTILGVMDSTAATVVRYTPGNGSVSVDEQHAQQVCLERLIEASVDAEGNAVSYNPPWLAMDCIVDSVIGIEVPDHLSDASGLRGAGLKFWNDNTDPSKPGMARGILNVLFASMGTSVLGIIIALMGFIFLYSLVFLIVKALYTYIAGYLGVAFMIIVAPLFIPLVLFRTTKSYFDKWLKLTLSFAMQPVFVLVFVIFSITAVDLVIFSGSYSIMYRLAGDDSRKPGFNLNNYLMSNQIIKPNAMTLAQIRTGRESTKEFTLVQKNTFLDKDVLIDCTEENVKNNPVAREICNQYYAIRVWRDQIDWEKAAEKRQPPVAVAASPENALPGAVAASAGKQLTKELLASTIFAALTVLIMIRLLNVLPTIVNGLLGEESQSPSLLNAVSRSNMGPGPTSMLANVGSLLKARR